MNSAQVKNMVLSQSIKDAWDEYPSGFSQDSFLLWDYIVLTASNTRQAEMYEKQIKFRIENRFLPDSVRFVVIPDPNGERVGSGGATFNVIRYIAECEKKAGNVKDNLFKGKRILVIHSGGDSKRVPQYSACGKLFSPVPRILPDGRRSTLFDEFIILMSGVARRIKDGMMVLSGDVLLLFDPLQINFQLGDAAAISIKKNVETGKNHGVFLSDKNGMLKSFLHKNSVESLRNAGAVNSQDDVDIDTGAVIFGSNIINSLYKLIDTEEGFSEFVNSSSRISFYADFIYPLADSSTLADYYNETPEGDFTPQLRLCREKLWNELSKYRMKVIHLSPAEFIHFGTTKELLSLLTENIDTYHFLGWEKKVLCNKDINSDCAVSNAYIESSCTIAESSYVENSILTGKCVIGEKCVISNMILNNATVPDGTVLHGLKQENGSIVVRRYSVDTDPKIDDFWNEKSFFEAATFEEALSGTSPHKLSLCESFNHADTEHILSFSSKVENKVRAYNFIKDIEKRVPVLESYNNFNRNGLTDELAAEIISTAENFDDSILMRVYYYLSKCGRTLLGKKPEELELKSFEIIQNMVVKGSEIGVQYNNSYTAIEDEVKIELPTRVNFGGGWSDTPPYCIENGGTVLNCAIKLNGILPVLVKIKRLSELKVVFESTDSGHKLEFLSVSDLQDCSNPFDHFALHKASFLACGVIPKTENCSLEDILKRIGCGIYMSTEVRGVPRGSGLGTSSILASACVRALFHFFGQSISENRVYETVMCVEQIMSTGGGWQDQVGGSPGLKYITTAVGKKQNIHVDYVQIPPQTKIELQERFVLVYTGQRRLARNLLRDVIGKYLSGDREASYVLLEIQRTAALMRFELEKGNVDEFAKLLDKHWELSKQLDSGCTNTCIDQILFAVEPFVDGRFIAGAGGGGFLQLILKRGVSAQQVSSRLKQVFGDSGIDVWTTELLF